MKTRYLLYTIPMIVLMVVVSGCTSSEETGGLVGYVEGEYVYVNSPQSGWLIDLHVAKGDSVVAMDHLFSLDNELETLGVQEARERKAQTQAVVKNLSVGARPAEIAALEARLADAEAQLELAQSAYDRRYPLVAQGIVAEAEGDALKSNLSRSKANVEAAQQAIEVAKLTGRDADREAAAANSRAADVTLQQSELWLKRRSIVSQVTGRVEMIFKRTGEFVTAGSPVLAILPPENIKIRFFVPQSAVSTLALGSKISVQPDGDAEAHTATITFIATEPEFTPPVIYSTDAREKLVFMIEASFDGPQTLRPGLPVDVRLNP